MAIEKDDRSNHVINFVVEEMAQDLEKTLHDINTINLDYTKETVTKEKKQELKNLLLLLNSYNQTIKMVTTITVNQNTKQK